MQERVSKTEIQAMLKRVISTDELKFAEDDLVYGPSAGGKLKDLCDEAGGKLLTDFEKPTEYDILQFSCHTMDKTVAKNSMIHFDLTYLKDVEGMLNNVGPYKDKITAGELRYIYEHWSSFSKNVKFYYYEMEVLPPWEE